MDNLTKVATAITQPNGPRHYDGMIRIAMICIAALSWLMFRPAVMPDPIQILSAIPALWVAGGLREALISSFLTSMQAIVISTAISLPLAYLSRIPIVRPLAEMVGQMRFLSPGVFFLILLFMLGSPHNAKIAMLVMGESFFLTTSMVATVQAIPPESFDEAMVLRMNDWQALWYVIIRGTLADAIEAISNNQAMGWSMLMMVEGALRSEGGVGVLTLNQERYMQFDGVYGIALTILLVGLGIDWLIKQGRGWACPHVNL